MKRIIVTIKNERWEFMYDIEIPLDLEGDKLADDIVQTLNGCDPSLYLQVFQIEIVCDRTGRILQGAQTAEELGIWNGDYLTVRRRGREYAKDYI